MKLTKFKQFAKRHWLPLAGFLTSAGIALIFGFTFMADAIYFNDPSHKDVLLQGWMTPRYVMLSYDIPRDLVMGALGLDESAIGQGLRVLGIAQEQNLSLDELTEKIRAIAQDFRESEQ